tara:strand:+ start:6243 stop:6713 length:471 start_codon:yes stop_codon:yes gene_type:complete
MIDIEHAGDLAAHAGKCLGRSQWMVVDQPMVDAFATLSGDTHWIHVDVARARAEMPNGETIVHGLLLLSLMPRLQQDIYRIAERGIGLNYGYDRVRFVAPAPVGAKIRLALTLIAAEAHAQGTRIITDAEIEVEGSAKPALVARHLLLVRDKSNED